MDAFDERPGPTKFNEGRKPTSLAIRFTEHPNEVPVAKRSSHGRLLSTLWLPNLGDELGSHIVCGNTSRCTICWPPTLVGTVSRSRLKHLTGAWQFNAESLSPFWGGSGPQPDCFYHH